MAEQDPDATVGQGGVEPLLEALGLPPDASVDDVRAQHVQLLSFLDEAPEQLRPWAEKQVELSGEALKVLEGEASGESAAAATAAAAASGSATKGTTPGAKASGRKARGKRRVNPLLVAAVILGVIFGVYFWGGGQPVQNNHPDISGTPAPTAISTPSFPPLDQAAVAQLKAKVDANPRDMDAMRQLSKLYYDSGDYKEAGAWQSRILQINPNDSAALRTLGLAQFNSDDMAGAEKSWLKAIQLDPKDALAHFDLGFLYLNKNDLNKAEEHWQKVVDIDPKSDLSQIVSSHLKRLKERSASPVPSATPSR
ncbi:tetratricopeptide repeat protein [Nigerium sp.]|jgi:tetratricopeptide (TPR) repeat protein|uniref:tetratricopeptide repeat protein n=1 Tax=Nigerium sp. TaxID=2042655 RepID=UPI003221FE0C